MNVIHRGCGGVMRKNTDICFTSMPPAWRWHCPKCDFSIVSSDDRLAKRPELQVFAQQG